MRALGRCVQWLKNHCNDNTFVILISVIIGLAAGFAAFVLKFMIGKTTSLLTGNLSAGHFNLQLLLYPLIGIILTGLYQRYILHRNIEHGVETNRGRTKAAALNLGRKYIYSPLIAKYFTLGFGGSAGSEGPIATVGGAIGGSLGRRLGLRPETIRVLIGCGAGAGIAGIFKSPVGGVLFTLEVLQVELGTITILAQFICLHCFINDGICAKRLHLRYQLQPDCSISKSVSYRGYCCWESSAVYIHYITGL